MNTTKDAAHAMEKTAVRTVKAAEKKLTLLWHEIEEWQQDNHFIIRGYRPASASYAKSFHSLSYIHNETVNIYTHLVGAVLAIISSYLLYSLFKPRYALATSDDIIAIGCFFVGATLCLGMSATFHTLSNHSPSVAAMGNKLDYLGILCLIWGSYIPSMYYGFHRDETLLRTYITMISTICAGTAVLCVMPRFRSAAFRPLRAGMFVLTGLSGVVPVLHGLSLYGLQTLRLQMGLSWTIAQGALYILGAAIYAARVPERFKPGTFDILGSSHQIFHCFVVAAAITHFIGVVKAFDYWHGLRHDMPPVSLLGKWW